MDRIVPTMMEMTANMESPIIASTTIWKLSLTIGMLPKKYPASRNPRTQSIPPMTLYERNHRYFIFPIPARNGAKVRMNGMKRAITMVRPPYFLK
ncbi:MAG: hypothetical protein A4E38_00895 [Methanoregulaceae archaeon PtaB.Bin108]|nr:MAG: hypothetical protein A4E38_00895 [Methanoregulaceae archaeon PtaB.Bin108]